MLQGDTRVPHPLGGRRPRQEYDGAVAQLGERRVRNAKAAGSIPAGSTKFDRVLDGELAVPCNPEPAIPGLNSHPRVCSSRADSG